MRSSVQELTTCFDKGRGLKNSYTGANKAPLNQPHHPYPEFSEFSPEQCETFEKWFHAYDRDRDGFLDLRELSVMLVKLGIPATQWNISRILIAADQDRDIKLSFRENIIYTRGS
ncbi:EF-hand domain-containing protein D2-like [Limulus polyphemus]|uniref:EF-hand domain-containing protein D2-like n=1 Tax=Limulus polyphemus TaxID=6850 RepID=A0ABM1RY00_LIMPO|nr:EF-hand domain-containing protein D2-like [Limulus polyphemus]